MLIRLSAYLIVLLLMIGCSSDDEVIQINDPKIEINFDKVEVSFDYQDYMFTALQESIILDLEVSYKGETGSNELLILWSVDNTNVDSQRGTFNETYQLELNDLGKEHYLVSVAVTNQTGDFIIEKSVILNNSTYVNLKYPAIGQKSEFLIYEYDKYGKHEDIPFPENCELTSEFELTTEVWEIVEETNKGYSLKILYDEETSLLDIINPTDSVYIPVDWNNFSWLLVGAFFIENNFIKISLSDEDFSYEDDNANNCLIPFYTSKFANLNHLNTNFNDAYVYGVSTGFGVDYGLLLNSNFEFVGSSFLFSEFTYSLTVGIRKDYHN